MKRDHSILANRYGIKIQQVRVSTGSGETNLLFPALDNDSQDLKNRVAIARATIDVYLASWADETAFFPLEMMTMEGIA